MATYEPSLADVIKNAVKDAQDLVRSEIALAKAEIRQEVSRLGMAVAFLAAAAVAGAIGVVFLMTTIAWAIAELLAWPVWSGFAIVTLLLLIAAAIFGYVGKSRITSARRMPRTVETMKENVEWMRTRTS